MLIIRQGYNQKDKQFISNVLYNVVDLYGDFYSTKDNLRISLRDNPETLFKYLKAGSQIIYEENNENGIALILKEKSFRTYIKILTNSPALANSFLKIISWHVKEDLYVKIKKNNNLFKTFQKNNFQFLGNRGNEVLLGRKYIARPEPRIFKGDEYESVDSNTRKYKN